MKQLCPCDSGKDFSVCCQPLLTGRAIANDAEALMRSRYTAYTLGLEDYLKSTWDERTCPNEKLTHDEPTRWMGLQVKKHTRDGDQAFVEFVARYKIQGRAFRLHEVSRFVLHMGRWYYVDGVFPNAK